MSYIGNTSTTQTFAAAIDTFNGDGTTTAFTLSRPVATVAQIEVVVNNVQQAPGSYTVSGNTLTFTGAPSSGTANIYVYYTSPVTQVIAPSTGTVGAAQLDIANFNGTGAMLLPTGTTAQRPATPVAGQVRYNSTTGAAEIYQSGVWVSYQTTYSVDYLVVAGGGGGGGRNTGGGGGAGGYISSIGALTAGSVYPVYVGAGGSAAAVADQSYGGNGSESSFYTVRTIGGGGGGNGVGTGRARNGLSGGSGGGGGGDDTGGPYTGGAGTSGQGYAGGQGTSPGANGGGGGGASSVGGDSVVNTRGGNGGSGSTWYDGVARGGGGGGGANVTAGTASSGGGAGGAATAGGTSGTANTGGGGGGTGGYGTGNASGAGGSGVVVIRYAGSQRGTGGTVTSSGGYTYHTFTTSGTFTA